VTDLPAIRERHHRVPDTMLGVPIADSNGYCPYCPQDWPCDTAQALARVAELEAALRECDQWVKDQVKHLAALARPESKP
jgi:hypothetical protein